MDSYVEVERGGYVTVRMTQDELKLYLDWKSGDSAKERNVKKGLSGIMELFLCSRPQACRIANSEWFRPAILYKEGKLMTFDADVAERLGKERINHKKAN